MGARASKQGRVAGMAGRGDVPVWQQLALWALPLAAVLALPGSALAAPSPTAMPAPLLVVAMGAALVGGVGLYLRLQRRAGEDWAFLGLIAFVVATTVVSALLQIGALRPDVLDLLVRGPEGVAVLAVASGLGAGAALAFAAAVWRDGTLPGWTAGALALEAPLVAAWALWGPVELLGLAVLVAAGAAIAAAPWPAAAPPPAAR